MLEGGDCIIMNENFPKLSVALKNIWQQFGRDLANQPDRLKGLLMDLYPKEFRTERDFLYDVMKENISENIIKYFGDSADIKNRRIKFFKIALLKKYPHWSEDAVNGIIDCIINSFDGIALDESQQDGGINFVKPLVKTDKTKEYVNAFRKVNIADNIFFGSYPQGKDGEKKPIEWIVAEKKENCILLVSRYGLDAVPYKAEYEDTTWENSEIRRFFNKDFYNGAFSADERYLIIHSAIRAEGNEEFNKALPGKDTKDYIFLLSCQEAEKFFSLINENKKCQATDYAIQKGVKSISGVCWWWLRNPGTNNKNATIVNVNGVIRGRGNSVRDKTIAVRPAIWLDIGNDDANSRAHLLKRFISILKYIRKIRNDDANNRVNVIKHYHSIGYTENNIND